MTCDGCGELSETMTNPEGEFCGWCEDIVRDIEAKAFLFDRSERVNDVS